MADVSAYDRPEYRTIRDALATAVIHARDHGLTEAQREAWRGFALGCCESLRLMGWDTLEIQAWQERVCGES